MKKLFIILFLAVSLSSFAQTNGKVKATTVLVEPTKDSATFVTPLFSATDLQEFDATFSTQPIPPAYYNRIYAWLYDRIAVRAQEHNARLLKPKK